VHTGFCVGRREGKRPLGSPRHRWQGNNKMGLQDVDVEAWTGLLWLKIGTSGGRLEWNVVMNLRDP
jgi:hypothetical protein